MEYSLSSHEFFFLPLNQMTETFNTASGHLAILSSSEDNIRQFLRYFTTFFVVTVFFVVHLTASCTCFACFYLSGGIIHAIGPTVSSVDSGGGDVVDDDDDDDYHDTKGNLCDV